MDLLPKSRLLLHSTSEKSNNSINPTENTYEEKASPADFMAFLPWACQQYELDVYVEISRIEQTKYVSRVENVQLRGKHSKILKTFVSESAKAFSSNVRSYDSDLSIDESKIVRIALTYCDEQLVQVKIDKTKHLPREVLAIIQIIIKFYPLLTHFSINSGADEYTIHEMCKILPISNITEMNFDNTYIKEANYDLVLDHSKQLKVLSLCRCKLDDHAVEKIASKLEYLSHASNTLSILNLSSNRLTNTGAQFLSKMLRTNRRLSYLNIANNMIDDEGAEAIFKVLNKFCLTLEEKLIVRGKYMKYLKKRQLLIDEYMKIFREAEGGMRKNKITKSNTGLKKPSNSNLKKSSSGDLRSRSLSNAAAAYEKALKKADIVCGVFDDPFGIDTFSEDGKLFSNGNNALAYLNIAYNNITHSSVLLLLEVLKHQRALARTPRGLVVVSLEGNPLPETAELLQVETILHAALGKDKSLFSSAAGKRRSSIAVVSKKSAYNLPN